MVFETGNGDFDPKYRSLIKSFELPDHLFFFSELALDKLLTRTGFTVVERTRYGTTLQLRIDRLARRALHSSGGAAVSSRDDRAWQALELARHTLRYRVGQMAPKRDRPYTMITAARRG
jgi:hypothetical protein